VPNHLVDRGTRAVEVGLEISTIAGDQEAALSGVGGLDRRQDSFEQCLNLIDPADQLVVSLLQPGSSIPATTNRKSRETARGTRIVP
jgi:hypothetical protein